MKLEDEIKQTKPFKNEIQKLVLNISVTSSWLNTILTEMLKPYEISAPQYNVLRILKGKYPDSYCNQEITARMIDKNSNATRIVDKLIVKGLVKRSENPGDRRAVEIVITEKGLALLEQIDLLALNNNHQLNKFDLSKAKQMNDWLNELRG
jgi:DNA-binding MarR family transcriptional regulator